MMDLPHDAPTYTSTLESWSQFIRIPVLYESPSTIPIGREFADLLWLAGLAPLTRELVQIINWGLFQVVVLEELWFSHYCHCLAQ